MATRAPFLLTGLGHLSATDRGVIMLRQHIRRGIRVVQAGRTLAESYLKHPPLVSG